MHATSYNVRTSTIVDNLYVWVFYTSKSDRRIKKFNHCKMLVKEWMDGTSRCALAYKPSTLSGTVDKSDPYEFTYDTSVRLSEEAPGTTFGVLDIGIIHVAWGPTDDDSKAYELLKESVFSSMDRQIEAAVEKINGWNKIKTDFVALTQ